MFLTGYSWLLSRYLVVTSDYLIVTTGYFSLLLVTSRYFSLFRVSRFSNNALSMVSSIAWSIGIQPNKLSFRICVEKSYLLDTHLKDIMVNFWHNYSYYMQNTMLQGYWLKSGEESKLFLLKLVQNLPSSYSNQYS